jgi:hypothetical protein
LFELAFVIVSSLSENRKRTFKRSSSDAAASGAGFSAASNYFVKLLQTTVAFTEIL